MIRFTIYQDGKKPDKLDPSSIYLFGQDEIPVRNQVEYVDGELMGMRHSDTAVGLVTLWNINGFGKVVQQTTRLPERKQPYNLNVEIVRGRLLRVSQKREEWGMSELTLTEQQHELLDNALEYFIDALCNLNEEEKASLLADKALAYAMHAGEEMALSHAKIFLGRRASTQGINRHCFGACIDPGRMHDKDYLRFIRDQFTYVTIPIAWRQLEPEEHQQKYDVLDECINWLHKHKIAVKVGPLLQFTPSFLPDWLFIWEHDFEQVRDMAMEFVKTTVERYGKHVQAWNVVSGMNSENCFKFSFEQIVEMTRSAVMVSRQAGPKSLHLIEVAEPWGGYYAQNQRTIPPIYYMDMICQSGANFDGFGLKMRFGRGSGGMQTRDMLDISTLLDKLSVFGKPLHIDALQVPSQKDNRDKNGDAGYWHMPWSEAMQADWVERVYQIALSKPFVEAVTWRDLTDRPEGALQHGGLCRPDLMPKPAFTRLIQLRDELLNISQKNGAVKNGDNPSVARETPASED